MSNLQGGEALPLQDQLQNDDQQQLVDALSGLAAKMLQLGGMLNSLAAAGEAQNLSEVES